VREQLCSGGWHERASNGFVPPSGFESGHVDLTARLLLQYQVIYVGMFANMHNGYFKVLLVPHGQDDSRFSVELVLAVCHQNSIYRVVRLHACRPAHVEEQYAQLQLASYPVMTQWSYWRPIYHPSSGGTPNDRSTSFRTMDRKVSRCCEYSFAASTLAGDSTFTSDSIDITESRMDRIV
jgi:hypothetical protein